MSTLPPVPPAKPAVVPEIYIERPRCPAWSYFQKLWTAATT
jgi:hypothetical protein